MNIKEISSFLDWSLGFNSIVEERQSDLDPVLIIREDDPGSLGRFRAHCNSRKDVLYVRLGQVSHQAYLGIELLLMLDPRFVQGKLKREGVPHESVILHLRRKILAFPFRAIIIVDNCQYLNFAMLFRILRMINELEGKAMFVFMLPEVYRARWEKEKLVNARLAFFLKTIKYHYEFATVKSTCQPAAIS